MTYPNFTPSRDELGLVAAPQLYAKRPFGHGGRSDRPRPVPRGNVCLLARRARAGISYALAAAPRRRRRSRPGRPSRRRLCPAPAEAALRARAPGAPTTWLTSGAPGPAAQTRLLEEAGGQRRRRGLLLCARACIVSDDTGRRHGQTRCQPITSDNVYLAGARRQDEVAPEIVRTKGESHYDPPKRSNATTSYYRGHRDVQHRTNGPEDHRGPSRKGRQPACSVGVDY